MKISLAQTDEEISACFAVMHQLRTHLVTGDFLERIRLQQQGGYQLCYLSDGGIVRSVAGFRIIENLASGRVLYVDDLVTEWKQLMRDFIRQNPALRNEDIGAL